MRRIGWIAFALSVSLAAPATAAERYALVIGNQGYSSSVGPLQNPHNDIAVVGKALAEVDFKLLAPLKDANREDILLGVYALAAEVRKAGRGAVSFLYYAGHGIAVAGENTLIPVNARNTSNAEIAARGVKLGEILDTLKREAPDAVHFVVVDACRNKLRGARGNRGFVPRNDWRKGMVVAFSTTDGETATDEGVGSAPYAAALAAAIVKPGYDDQDVFNAVRARVVDVTRNQTPWINDGLIGDRVVFKAAAAPPPARVAAPPAGTVRLSEAGEAWSLIKDSTDARELEAFVHRFGDTFYGDLAKAALAELKQADAAKQAEAAAKKTADEEARAKAEAERQRLALLQREQAKARAKAAAAGQRQEEEARAKAELERQLTQRADILEAQERLYELNYDPGSADGALGRQTEQALREFEANLGLQPTGRLTVGLLNRLKSAGNLKPWGAIVFSEATQEWGISWGHDTRKAATAAAQASCRSDPSACSKVLTFFGTGCGAFAHSTASWSLFARDTSAKARSAALEECQKQGTRCSIVATVCAGGQHKAVSSQ